MARLVAVRIHADQAGHIHRHLAVDLGALIKQRVEFAHHSRFAAHQRRVALRIMLREPGGLPGVGFGVIAPFLRRAGQLGIERRGPIAVFQARADEAGGGVPQLAIILRAFNELLIVATLAKHACQLSHGPIVVGILERLGGRFFFLVAGDITELAIVAQPAIVVFHRALHNERIDLLVVDAFEAFYCRLGDYDDRMVAGHATCFRALQRPDRHARRAFGCHADQAIDQGRHALGLHDRVKRMQRAVCVPQRKCAVVVRAFGHLVDLHIHSAILTIDIVE